jgi:hypothetical protein
MAYSITKKQSIVATILNEYAKGKYSIKSLCLFQGVDFKTFKKWQAEFEDRLLHKQSKIPPFESDMESKTPVGDSEEKTSSKIPPIIPIPETYLEAQQRMKENQKAHLLDLAYNALEKQLQPFEYEEKEKYGLLNDTKERPRITKVKITRKIHFPPPILIMRTLECLDPDHFGRNNITNQNSEHNTWIELLRITKVKE